MIWDRVVACGPLCWRRRRAFLSAEGASEASSEAPSEVPRTLPKSSFEASSEASSDASSGFFLESSEAFPPHFRSPVPCPPRTHPPVAAGPRRARDEDPPPRTPRTRVHRIHGLPPVLDEGRGVPGPRPAARCAALSVRPPALSARPQWTPRVSARVPLSLPRTRTPRTPTPRAGPMHRKSCVYALLTPDGIVLKCQAQRHRNEIFR